MCVCVCVCVCMCVRGCASDNVDYLSVCVRVCVSVCASDSLDYLCLCVCGQLAIAKQKEMERMVIQTHLNNCECVQTFQKCLT